MSIPITRTKIISPRRRSDLLYRQRLIDLLYDLVERRLILVSAPAGYGKTSLLVDFVDQLEMPLCWLTLDALDNDLHRFIYYFIASLEEKFPQVAKRVRSIVQSTPNNLDLERLVTALVNASLNIAGHFIMVLDDYHFVSDESQIGYFISRLVQQCGDNFHLILATRTLPALPDFPLMVARRQVGGLSFEELAFRPSEVQELMWKKHNLPISGDDAQELVETTEGWITGLLLSAQTVGKAMAHQLRLAQGSGVNLYDYLAQQVLEQQPPELQDFLLRTSVMAEFNAEMCYDLLGDPAEGQNWYDFIDILQQSNLFVLSIGDSWVRYHNLFRNFLQARLARKQPKESKRLRRKLAQWHTENEEWEKAHTIYKELGDLTADAELIEQAGSALIKSGRIETLSSWINALPLKLRNTRPGLLSLRGTTLSMQGQVTQSLFLLDQAIQVCRTTQNQPLLARTLIRRATRHRLSGNYEAALSDAEEALVIAKTKGLQFDHAQGLRIKGMSLYHLGYTQDAISCLSDSLTLYEILGEAQNIAILHLELGMAEMYAGHYVKGLNHYTRALSYWEMTDNAESLANVLNNLAVLHQLRGNYEMAIITLERALAQAREAGSRRMEAYILCSIGDLYVEFDALAPAQEAYRQSRDPAQRNNDRFLLFYLLLAEAGLRHMQGRLQQAGYLLEEAVRLTSESGSVFENALLSLARGRLALRKNSYLEAVSFLDVATRDLEEAEQRPEAARAHLYLAMAFYGSSNQDAALSHLNRAFQLAAQLESEHTLLIAGRDVICQLNSWHKSHANQPNVKKLIDKTTKFNQSLPSLQRRLRRHIRSIPLDPPKLIIRALGDASALVKGREVEWGWAKVRDLLFCLLIHRRGLTKEEIGELLWPESSASQLKNRFKDVRKSLRRVMGADSVLFHATRYLFNDAIDYEYDVELFLSNLEQVDSLTSTTEKIQAYERAVDYYRGPLLPLVEDEWVITERERLHQLYVSAMVNLASLYLEQGELQAALNRCEKLLSVDPAQEEAHRVAMRVYAARGHQAGIARQFEQCQQALESELAVPVSEQTRTLYQTLMAQ
ncbi:MAG: tetratricopeptide repeat protein [Ardenticatenaceae bacterium]